MEKFSVKKPFTVLVAVIMVLMLGFVALTKMQTNLLPDVSTPYLMVVTVYPGASPERVESEVSDVMENALGTVSGVETITATSAENYNLLLMQFNEGTDMNSALVKVSNKIDQTTASLPSSCLTPSIIEYNLNMNAFMTVAVSREGSDVYGLSDFVSDTLVPYVERKGGVSSVSTNGLIEKLVQVQLNQSKIDVINERLLEVIDVQLAEAKAQLDDAEAQINAGRKEYEKQLKNFGNTVSDQVMSQMGTQVADAVTIVRDQAQALLESVNQLIGVVQEPEIQQALIEVRDGLQHVMDQFNETGMRDIDSLIEIVAELRTITDKLTTALQQLQARLNVETGTEGSTATDLADDLQVQQSLSTIYNTLESTIKAMDNVPDLMNSFSQALGSYSYQQLNAYMQFSEARDMLNTYETQFKEAQQQYEDAKQKALASADVSKMLDIDTLAQLIYAQNFSMPAGYVDDKDGNSWLLKVGEEYNSVEDIEGALLLHVDGFGDVRLSDVADVEIIDNAEESYTRLNGERAAVLKIFKSTSSSASTVSDNCLEAFRELEAQYDGLHVVVLSNQGNYITIIVKSILSSMAMCGTGHHRAGHLPQGHQADPRCRHQHPALRRLCRRFDVLHRLGYERHDAGRPLPWHWYAGGQLGRRHRKRLPPAQPRHPGGSRRRDGHPAGRNVHCGFYPDLDLRIPARHLLFQHRPQPAAAHVSVHRLLSDCFPDRGHDRCSGSVGNCPEKGGAEEAGVV